MPLIQVIMPFIFLKLPFNVFKLFPVTNLTSGTEYEVAVWAHTNIGDSPTAVFHHRTTGTQPEKPLLKAKALNQTAVDCSWTLSTPLAKVQKTFIVINSVQFDFIYIAHRYTSPHRFGFITHADRRFG